MVAVRRGPVDGTIGGGTRSGSGLSLKRWAPRPVARMSPAMGNPRLARLLAAAKAADWPAMRDELSAVSDDGERGWLIANATEVAGYEQWMPKAVADEPESGLALLVAGARQVVWAWEARTGLRAKHVSREQFQIFHERLGVAEDLLYRAAELEPGWASPWYFLQMSARGLQLGQDISRLRFEAATRRFPEHLGAHQQQLQQVCAKWGGSHDEMHAFARASALNAPEGSALGVLVAVAHLEHWLDLDHGATDSPYMRSGRVVAELHEAADRSYRHAAYGEPVSRLGTLNTFALAFVLAGEKKAAAAAFTATGGLVTEFPWQYLDGDVPVSPYRTMRFRAGRP
ncbi:hypothetical protein SAMN05216252_103340 [Actinacidiphila glaucinigra]|uniref:DUF4034 domain-containing protein n=2 Tax=Actinacidiphila glaucinigra TaxID=235986 RepID=A0A239C3X8_9ACTN|nr:hypothetical protein SAMN05216252_103340 [Actinacidiphila glaucinigra]